MVRISFSKYWVNKQLEHICKLAEEKLKMPVWKYNETCYLTTTDKTCY